MSVLSTFNGRKRLNSPRSPRGRRRNTAIGPYSVRKGLLGELSGGRLVGVSLMGGGTVSLWRRLRRSLLVEVTERREGIDLHGEW